MSASKHTLYPEILKQLLELDAWLLPLRGRYGVALPDDEAEYDRWKVPTRSWLDRAACCAAVRGRLGGNHWAGLIPASLGLVVLDLDEGDGDRLAATLSARDYRFLRVQTRRGWHFFMRAADDWPEGNWKWTLAGCAGDVRFDAGYVILWDPIKTLETIELGVTGAADASLAADMAGGQPSLWTARTDAIPGEPAARGWRLPNNWRDIEAGILFPPGDRDERLFLSINRVFLSDPDAMPLLEAKWKSAPRQKGDHAAKWDEKLKRCNDQNGGRGYKSNKKTASELRRAFVWCGLSFRLNMRSGRFDFKHHGKTAPIETSSEQEVAYVIEVLKENCFQSVMKKKGKQATKDDPGDRPVFEDSPWTWSEKLLRQVLNACTYDSGRYDPFISWLESRRDWDGVKRLDSFLHEKYGAEAGAAAAWVMKAILIGAIQRAYEPGCELHTIPVLIGAQGIGKSSLCKYLLPPERRNEWHGASFDMSIKDTKARIEATVGNVFVEWPEMAGAMKDLQATKAYLTNPYDQARLAYGHDPTNVLRRFMFIITADRIEVIPNDPEGNRRFFPIELFKAWLPHLEMTEELRDQLWAEALHLYRGGVRAHLPPELKAIQEARNLAYRRVDETVEDAVSGLDRRQAYSFTEIKEKCPGRVSQNVILTTLRAAGWQGDKQRWDGGRSVRKWHVPGEYQGKQGDLDIDLL
ncbi:MAG: hypothetical protein OXE52_03395 [Chloroflexi bacterium]|nr:hypothetical protein [Chloroflexota bacterium]